jgi:uncharacterized protein YdcH (DUF465 family)
MRIEYHDFYLEFPEYKDDIHALKTSDAHFRRLYDEYNDLTKHIVNMENEIIPATTVEEENAKLQRVVLKDQWYKILKKHVDANSVKA